MKITISQKQVQCLMVATVSGVLGLDVQNHAEEELGQDLDPAQILDRVNLERTAPALGSLRSWRNAMTSLARKVRVWVLHALLRRSIWTRMRFVFE